MSKRTAKFSISPSKRARTSSVKYRLRNRSSELSLSAVCTNRRFQTSSQSTNSTTVIFGSWNTSQRQRNEDTTNTDNTSLIYLSSDDDDGDDVITIDISTDAHTPSSTSNVHRMPAVNNIELDIAMNLELENIMSDFNYDPSIQSDIDNMNIALSDIIDNDIPIEYHDQTIDESYNDNNTNDINVAAAGPSKFNIETVDLCSPKTKPPESVEVKKALLECPICLEDLKSKSIYSTVCGHVFCKECIFKVLKNSKKCPQCRKTLNKKQIHPIFF